MRKYVTVVTIAAMLLVLSAAPGFGKPPPSDRSHTTESTTSYMVAADFWNDWEWGHVEAMQTESGSFIRLFQWDGRRVCSDNGTEDPWDDLFVNFDYRSFDEELPLEADVFTIGGSYSTGYVVGDVHVGVGIDSQCTGQDWTEMVLHVTLDLTGNDTTIREKSSSWFRSPDFTNTTSFTFSGRGAYGTVEIDQDYFGDYNYFDSVEGRIGLSRYRSMSSS